MIFIFIDKGRSRNIVSGNNRDNKDIQINTPVPTVNDNLLLQLDIITTFSIVLFNATAYSILHLCCYWLRDV